MEIGALILDGLILFIFLFYFIRNWKRGFLASLFRVLGFAIASCGAYIGSRALAETIYQLFLRQKFIKTVSEALSTASADLTKSVEAVTGSVPKLLQGFFFDFFGGREGVTDEVGSLMSNSVQSMSVSVTDEMIYPIIYTVLQALCFILLFFAIMIVVRGLSKILRGVKHIPLLGPVNSLLGGILGILQGVLMAVIIVLALNLFNGMTANNVSYVNEQAIGETYVFKYFYEWNPIGGLSASVGDLGFSGIELT